MVMAARIIEIVSAIPAGYVSTYGDIAGRAGSRAPRFVGRVLADLADEDTPWHRVVRSDGRPASHLIDEQFARLREEGVIAHNGRIDLRRYRWISS